MKTFYHDSHSSSAFLAIALGADLARVGLLFLVASSSSSPKSLFHSSSAAAEPASIMSCYWKQFDATCVAWSAWILTMTLSSDVNRKNRPVKLIAVGPEMAVHSWKSLRSCAHCVVDAHCLPSLSSVETVLMPSVVAAMACVRM